MRLCMFHPADQPLERGWVGRVDGEHVTQLAAQTLQSFFTGGGQAREHAVYPLAGVRLLAPVLHPPAIRVFESETAFEFANPAAVLGPNAEVAHRTTDDWLHLDLLPRVAAVVGERGEIAGFTLFADWRAPKLGPPKDRDFAIGLGPVVVTPDDAPEMPTGAVRVFGDVVLSGGFPAFDWDAARAYAAADTALKPGDLLAGPPLGVVEDIEPATAIELEVDGIGVLPQSVHPADEP
jgi:Domain of unknown function (DUF2437)